MMCRDVLLSTADITAGVSPRDLGSPPASRARPKVSRRPIVLESVEGRDATFSG